MGKPSAPKPPDPRLVSREQTNSNVDTASANAALNAVNQVSPFGTVNYDRSGTEMVGGREIPRYTQTTTLAPQEQALYDKTNEVNQQALGTAGTAIGQAQNVLSTPFSLNNLPAMGQAPQGGDLARSFQVVNPTFGIADAGPIQRNLDFSGLPNLPGANDFSAERKRVEDATLARFNEDIGKREADIVSQLNAQGLQRGSAAYNDEMTRVDRDRNDARIQAILAGGQEQSRLFRDAAQARGQLANERVTAGNFGLGAQAQAFGQNAAQSDFYNQAAGQATAQNQGQAGFWNTAQQQGFDQALRGGAFQNQNRQQSIAEQQLLRSLPLNEVAMLLGLGPGMQMPTGAPNFGINMQPTDVTGAYALNSQVAMNNYNQKMAANNNLWGSLGNLGGNLGAAWMLR